ncbi:hypothetical protein BC936DRAFT_140969 [Jimgerdemannia flammicorona]|uniref:Uncharacterized protein n=1 Tax=Jimgerdemannia flammicorona TaxID=994334 RepID=A0A433A360_9FUNG|nr:hypothetical protein BC936DRAFT_140969 [Jimgerdemannia flammicorona]
MVTAISRHAVRPRAHALALQAAPQGTPRCRAMWVRHLTPPVRSVSPPTSVGRQADAVTHATDVPPHADPIQLPSERRGARGRVRTARDRGGVHIQQRHLTALQSTNVLIPVDLDSSPERKAKSRGAIPSRFMRGPTPSWLRGKEEDAGR